MWHFESLNQTHHVTEQCVQQAKYAARLSSDATTLIAVFTWTLLFLSRLVSAACGVGFDDRYQNRYWALKFFGLMTLMLAFQAPCYGLYIPIIQYLRYCLTPFDQGWWTLAWIGGAVITYILLTSVLNWLYFATRVLVEDVHGNSWMEQPWENYLSALALGSFITLLAAIVFTVLPCLFCMWWRRGFPGCCCCDDDSSQRPGSRPDNIRLANLHASSSDSAV